MKINLRHKITQRLHVFFKVLQLLVYHGAKYPLDLTFLTINKDKKQAFSLLSHTNTVTFLKLNHDSCMAAVVFRSVNFCNCKEYLLTILQYKDFFEIKAKIFR